MILPNNSNPQESQQESQLKIISTGSEIDT